MTDAAGPGWVAAGLAGVEHSPDLVTVLRGDDLVVEAASARVRALFAGRPVVGLPIDHVYIEDGARQVLDQVRECYRTGAPVAGVEWRMRLDDADGTPRELTVDFAVEPWRDASGGMLGVVTRGADVTERVRAGHLVEEGRRRTEGLLDEAREVSTTVQQALLPDRLPLVPGLDIAARYLLAVDGSAAGGDWFDVVVRPAGCVALVTGDVVGHGVTAAAVMGQLRAVLHERLASGVRIDEAVSALDAFVGQVPGADAATVCVAEVDVASGEVQLLTAGHPPPLTVGTESGARFLEPSGGGPLGTGAARHVATDELGPDEMLLVYTDGLVDRPGLTPAQNTVELVDTAERIARSELGSVGATDHAAQRVCEQTLTSLTRTTGYVDDITLVVARRIPIVPALQLDLPADTGAIGEVRARMADWLTLHQVGPIDVLAVQHAIGELVSNAVTHAYRGEDPGRVAVDADVAPTGHLELTVRDRGRWRSDADHPAGQGLAMSRAFVDELEVEHDSGGTVARVRHALTRPAQLVSESQSVLDRAHDVELETSEDDGTLWLSGPMDVSTSELLAARIRRATRGGTHDIVLDLNGVTVLASAGVQVLQSFRDAGVHLRAAPGTPAQHVLELVRLPYEES